MAEKNPDFLDALGLEIKLKTDRVDRERGRLSSAVKQPMRAHDCWKGKV